MTSSVPTGLRRPAAVLAAASALGVALLGWDLHGTSAPGPVDQVLAVAVRQTWTPGRLAYALDGLVTPVPALVLVGALAAVCLVLARPRLALVAAVGPLGSYVVTTGLKWLVGRTIHGANLSFPSGHTAFATAVGLVVGLLVATRLRLRPGPAALVVLLVGIGCGTGMAIDQVLLDAHYPTDTAGGMMTALALVLGLALALDALVGHAGRRVPAAPQEQRSAVRT